MKLQLPKWLLSFSGHFYIHKYPGFFLYKPHVHKIKGHEIREIINNLKEGDILLRRLSRYLNTIFTPGFWGHAALYVGEGKVIHAVGEGVVYEDILDFCRCDSVCILRLDVSKFKVKKAIHKAKEYEKERTGYDYKFASNNGTVYCTELVDLCYTGIFAKDYEEELGNNILLPEGIYNSTLVTKVIEFKH